MVFMAHSCIAWIVWKPETTFFSPDSLRMSAMGTTIAVDKTTIVVGINHNMALRTLVRTG